MKVYECIERFVKDKKPCKASCASRGIDRFGEKMANACRVRSSGITLRAYEQPIAVWKDNVLHLDCRRFSLTTDQYQQNVASYASRAGVPVACDFFPDPRTASKSYPREEQRFYRKYGFEPEVDNEEWARRVRWSMPASIVKLHMKNAQEQKRFWERVRELPYGSDAYKALSKQRDARDKHLQQAIKRDPTLKRLSKEAGEARMRFWEEVWEHRGDIVRDAAAAKRRLKEVHQRKVWA